MTKKECLPKDRGEDTAQGKYYYPVALAKARVRLGDNLMRQHSAFVIPASDRVSGVITKLCQRHSCLSFLCKASIFPLLSFLCEALAKTRESSAMIAVCCRHSAFVIPDPEWVSGEITNLCVSIPIILGIKKVPTLTTKLNQEKKLSIGTRGIGFCFFG